MKTMKTMKIYEPSMCCATGLCGVSVNPELLRMSTVLDSLKKKGVDIERYNLSSAPHAFISNKIVSDLLNVTGVEILPIVMVEGEIVITKRYPTNEELLHLLEIPADYITGNIKKSGGCCGGKEGGC